MNMNRRTFLLRSAALSAGFAGLSMAMSKNAFASLTSRAPARDYGPLLKDSAKLLDLPAGFSYQLFSRLGETMDDGLLVPGKHDGMAAFSGPDGTTILVRNHELEPTWVKYSPFGPGNQRMPKIDASRIYDAGTTEFPCIGGTTTLQYDTKSKSLKKHFMSLAGTMRNCAGGPTPWGTWLTCEEVGCTPADAGEADKKFNVKETHGWVFEVPASIESGLIKPEPIKAMGRFFHEAVALDPRTGIIYLTEDRVDGLLYRFIPHVKEKLKEGGTLQALAVLPKWEINDSRNWEKQTIKRGDKAPVRWIDLEDVESLKANDLRHRGFASGATRFARGEGMWTGNDGIYFDCTNGGSKRLGQIFRYVPSPHEGTAGEKDAPGALELFLEPNDASVIQYPDNMCISPWGDLFVCEDGNEPNHMVRVTPQGHVSYFGQNSDKHDEFAGACFSPDGSTMFVNMQSHGATLAITGPWNRD